MKNRCNAVFFTHALIEFVCFESTLYFITLKGFRWRSMIEGAYVGQWHFEQQTDLFLGVSGHSWERESEKTIAGTNSVHHTCVNRAKEWVYVQFYSLWISNTHFHSIKQNIFFPITDFLWTQTFVQLAFSLYIGQGRAFWMFYYINAPLGPYEEQLTEPSGPFCNK